MSTPIIEFKHITKRFPGIIANDDVSFSINQGEIYALLGENGAGKSTLMSMLFGMYTPDKGGIWIRGRKENISSPNVATELGIGMVHQHFKLVDNYTITENVILGREGKHKIAGFIPYLNSSKQSAKIKELSKQYGLEVDPEEKIEDISVSTMQRVEIIKMLYREAEILIFDEPSAVLTPQEIESLLNIIENLKKDGKTIILITHKLKEVAQVADRCAVLRKGKLIDVLSVPETPIKTMANLMVGREIDFEAPEKPSEFGKPVLEISNLSAKSKAGVSLLSDINLQIRAGEILAIAGVSGNGQIELAEAIAGMIDITSGKIVAEGQDITDYPIDKRVRELIAYIPEDRQREALVLDMDLRSNMILKHYEREEFRQGKFINWQSAGNFADKAIEEFDVRSAQGRDTIVRYMSGGNQQKAIIAREIYMDAPIMIFVQPTRGLDIGAIENIHKEIIDQQNQGKAILLISLELEEIFALADTIAVIYNGKIVHKAPAKDLDNNTLGDYMLGVLSDEE